MIEMVRRYGLRGSLERHRMLIARSALLSLTITFVIAQFSLYEEDEEDEAKSPMITLRLECPRCLRQQMAAEKQSVYCSGTWRHPHLRVKMLPSLR
jgi:hypothetical protein